MTAPWPVHPEPLAEPLTEPSPEALLTLCRALVPSWASVESAEVCAVGGGITNELWRLRAPGRPPLLVRRFGPRTELVIDRERERGWLQTLGAAGLAPAVYGGFPGGRIEQWWEGFRPLAPDEMADHSSAIAACLSRLHATPVEGGHRLWGRLRAWMTAAQGLRLPEPDRELRRQALSLPSRAADLEALITALERLEGHPGMRPVLAHNDLLSGNILLHEESGEIRFVDFEYADLSPAAFDLANHLCEHTGFASDFARDFPSAERRRAFVAHWLGDPQHPELDRHAALVDHFVLIDHLFWGSWAVLQAAWSPISFDFLRYAELRFAGFDLHREAHWPPPLAEGSRSTG